MTADDLREFLFDQIPLARALEVSVAKCDAISAELTAPLEPNRNHLGTAFGGSLGAMLILSGYTWLYNAMESRGLKCHVLLKKTDIDYLHPVDGKLEAIAQAPDTADLEKFLETFRKKGSARITLRASIACSQGTAGLRGAACTLIGEFVAKKSSDSKLA